MKPRLYKLGAVMFLLTLGVVVFWNVNHWRLYDDLWQPLALTHAENYCSGRSVASDNYSKDTDIQPGCIEESGFDNTTPSINQSAWWGCEGVHAEDPSFPVNECVNQVKDAKIWFLLDGGWTRSWSDARPYPTEVTVKPQDSRGSSRADFEAPPTTAPANDKENE